MRGVIATIGMSAAGKLNGGVFALFVGYMLKLLFLLPMLFLWRSFAAAGADLGSLSLEGLLTYTCVSTMLGQVLNPATNIVTWNYDGKLVDFYRRPATVFGQLIARTLGDWLPELLLFSLPMAVALPILGVRLTPVSAWFFPSLALTASLGFALDFLYTCYVIRLKNAVWMAQRFRAALISLLSGAVIPFALLPRGLGAALSALPFGSLAAAPLALCVGSAKPGAVIPMQLFWNAALWPLAFIAWRESREVFVSYGG